MSEIRSLCVYCGSSNNIDQKYKDLAAEVGREFAKQGIKLIFGGGRVGLMGIVSDACMKAGGQVVGIMTEFLFEYEGAHTGITELHVVKSMHERKMAMFDRSDGFLIMPGGFGTLDEAFEVLTWRQIGLHNKPVVWLNAYNYWEALLKELVPHMATEGFVRENDRYIYETVSEVPGILPAFKVKPSVENDFVSKWG